MDDGPWTPEHVCQLMIEAFRLLPTMPVYSPRRGILRPVGERSPGPLKVLAWSERYLARPDQVILLSWARAMAAGSSVREVCRSHAWSWSTFKRHRLAACQAIADGLNRDGIAFFNLGS